MESAMRFEKAFLGDIEKGRLGIWLFLLSEILLFGGFLASYVLLRLGSSVCALGAPAWPPVGYVGGLSLATLNTAILITSSFTMVRAVQASRDGRKFEFSRNLLWTILLGCGFLVVKGIEYHAKIHHGYFPGSEFIKANPGLGFFVSYYYGMTGLHLLHVVIGLVWNGLLLRAGGRRALDGKFADMVEYAGLYWHFIDIVWVFLYPLFYLV